MRCTGISLVLRHFDVRRECGATAAFKLAGLCAGCISTREFLFLLRVSEMFTNMSLLVWILIMILQQSVNFIKSVRWVAPSSAASDISLCF